MTLFNWGEKRFARGIANAMIRSYKLHKKIDPSLSEFELVKKTLADRPGEPAKKLLEDIKDSNFWENTVGSLLETVYILVRLEYVEYMGDTIENEDQKTNIFFRNTILEELNKN